MSRNRSQNVLLVEIMIAVLFFALCSTVILEVFVTAREYSRRSAVKSEALMDMQDAAEQIYASTEGTEGLLAAGFEQDGDCWRCDRAEYDLEVRMETEETAAGTIRRWNIRALQDESVIAEIPGARYFPGGAAE